MSLTVDIKFVQSALDRFGNNYHRMGVASTSGLGGVPPEMFDGEIDAEGWVGWEMLPSTLSQEDIVRLESEFRIDFPPLFRAYLLARFQLFDQIYSAQYDQAIFNVDVPSNNPLGPIRDLINAWIPLLSASYIPFAQWGDGWGPMCFDTENRNDNGDCPIVWMDHELLIPLGEDACRNRQSVLPYVNLLYPSYRDFFEDTFQTKWHPR